MKKTFIILLFFLGFNGFAQIKSPTEQFGFQPGADYKLATYDQMLTYYEQLAKNSPRVQYFEIGKTVLGKPMMLLAISSEENIKNLEKHRQTAEKLAKAEIGSAEAETLIANGKAIVWIDGGLHATEVAGAQMTPELAYFIATDESKEVKKIRNEVIMLLMPVMNPDGLEIVSQWYFRNLGTPFETSGPPWLYHHYIGHDNNRDWFMNNMPESYHVNDQIYRKWYPQVVYNHHQTSPAWARIFIPPFSNPVNPKIHPGITTATNMIGTVMANRFAMEKKPGVVSYQTYSMWWNGGMRTVPYYHNMVGILTETGHATPTPRYYDPKDKPEFIGGRRGGMSTDATQIFYPYPWEGGESKFRGAVDYMLTGSMAVLDFAADRREEYLGNIYRMGRDAIEGAVLGENYTYVIPAEQADRIEAINLVNILWRGGIEIGRADKNGEYDGISIKKGDFVISTSQAFRPYLEDLMEPQKYPDQFLYPGGPPNPPYDLAGWTLPMQMGVEVSKIQKTIDMKTVAITGLISEQMKLPKIKAAAYVFKVTDNASFKAVNALLKEGKKVYRITEAKDDLTAGDFVVPAEDLDMGISSLTTSGATVIPLKTWTATNKDVLLKRKKVGLYKSWTANMDEGWTRWLLTDYYFDWDTLHNADIQQKDLSVYDVIILPDQNAGSIVHGHRKGTMPDEFVGGIEAEGVVKLIDYVKSGGEIISFDGAGDFVIEQFGLPVRNVTSGVSPQQFFVPGSLLKVSVNQNEYSWGVPNEIAVSFSQSSAYSIINLSYSGEGGEEKSVKKGENPTFVSVANYAKENLLMSGWGLGEKSTIGGKSGMMVLPMEKGKVVMFGFRPQFRGQPRASYKLLFNAILN